MMPRRLLALNLLLAAVCAVLLAYVVREATAPVPMPIGGRRAAAPAAPAATAEAPRPAAGAYVTVATRNVFSPTRTESASTTGVAAVAPAVKPSLMGVVVRETGSIAYLEDPTTKRVSGYRVGDNIVGGTVQTIRGDSVVIARPDGDLDVRLHDPSRPRPAAAPGTPAAGVPATGIPGQQPAAPIIPGIVPPLVQPPGVVQGQPPAGTQPTLVPGRRPLPPNLMRRLPPGTGDATQQ